MVSHSCLQLRTCFYDCVYLFGTSVPTYTAYLPPTLPVIWHVAWNHLQAWYHTFLQTGSFQKNHNSQIGISEAGLSSFMEGVCQLNVPLASIMTEELEKILNINFCYVAQQALQVVGEDHGLWIKIIISSASRNFFQGNSPILMKKSFHLRFPDICHLR